MPSEDNLATLISISVTRRGFGPFADTYHPGGLRCLASSVT